MKGKELIKKDILNKVNSLDIAGYLKEELATFLGYFHCYKLNNIWKNIDFLQDYLVFLDQKNTKEIDKLEYKDLGDIDIGAHDPYYYISRDGLAKIGEKELKQKIVQKDYNLNSAMMGIKGFLLLTMDEFCNATPVRLSISKIMRDKESKMCK